MDLVFINPDFLTEFAACVDLLKNLFMFKNQNITQCQNNHTFLSKKPKIITKKTPKQIDNLGFVKTRFVKTSYEQVMKLQKLSTPIV